MTEAVWLSSTDPAAMLDYLLRRNQNTGTVAGERMGNRVSDRKLRLLALACWSHNREWRVSGEMPAGAEAVSAFDQVEPHRAAALLRDIAGNPFRPVTWTGEQRHAWTCRAHDVLRLARAAYDQRQPDDTLDSMRLLILRDALLDADCPEESLLDHLASEGPHVRGCWALDLVLGRD